jgi:hypothetical protein
MTCRITIHNQDGDLVMEGEQKYLLRLHPPGQAPAEAVT